MHLKRKIKWGIIGLGRIATSFANDLLLVADAEIYAVASRNQDKANAFAEKFGAVKAYNNYDELINDADIDILYIATPHHVHASLSIEALNSGKHVLCEKPIAMNFKDASAMIKASRENQKFFMEAFWTRFNPSIRETLSKIRGNEIGEVKYIHADFGFKAATSIERLTNLDLGGGSLLDIGVYPLFLSYLILGKPKKILAAANFYTTKADKQTSMILHYDDAQAVLHSNFLANSNMTASISGTEGRINLDRVWHHTQSFAVIKNDEKEAYSFPLKGRGFTYEIEECHKCIKNKQIESKLWSHQNSLDLIEIVDEVKKQIGLEYPND